MDPDLEQTCLEEITHKVMDAREKVSVRVISNNYGLDYSDAVKVLQRWIDKNCVKTKLTKEYIVRGVDIKKGNVFITVADEKKVGTIESKAKNVSSMLYSVSVASDSSKSLNIQGNNEIRVVKLSLKAEKRDVKVFTPTNPPPTVVKQESKPKINSMFTASASNANSKPKTEPKPPVKEEKQSPPAIKQESEKTPASQKSPNKKKDDKKATSGKGSIASYFSNKAPSDKPSTASSTSTTAEKPAVVKVEKLSPKHKEKQESDDTVNSNGTKVETQRWKRMISDSEDEEVVPNTPQEKKETKKKGGGKKPLTFKKGGASKANPSKKSRILEIEDSSEEEDEGNKSLKEPEERLIVFDFDDAEDTEMKEEKIKKEDITAKSPVEKEMNGSDRRRAKVRKMVTKTFMDSDSGYLITTKDYEMVSASEDEADAFMNNNNAAKRKDSPTAANANGKKQSEAKTNDKKASKVTPPTPKTKQGSLMSFFSKK
ncbi:DNA polymerase delta subunit 3 [Toxorhynchites rutilus septentrionalis]|uniref:DNA polymerase delta subunit 3 n=1 Tax=Toxorhynchites rutilus septentrionalis TaxID=329112 RepID=UPI00247B0506|nr:DNA polymerase delta subunit 3 [Toxorhynchites rutilus septentrionalis]